MGDRNQFTRAWREAPDEAVRRAIRDPQSIEPEARSIVNEEAARRGIEVGGVVGGPLKRHFAIEMPHRFVIFLATHRTVLSALLGTAYAFGTHEAWNHFGDHLTTNIQIALMGSLLLVLQFKLLAVVCWPFVYYGRTLLRILVFTSTTMLIRLLVVRPEDLRALGSQLGFILGVTAALVMTATLDALLLVSIVCVRRWRWPIHPPGHCRRCGYDLRMLVEPRCPECGTPFDSAARSEARAKRVASEADET